MCRCMLLSYDESDKIQGMGIMRLMGVAYGAVDEEDPSGEPDFPAPLREGDNGDEEVVVGVALEEMKAIRSLRTTSRRAFGVPVRPSFTTSYTLMIGCDAAIVV